jgi:competence protein ComEA
MKKLLGSMLLTLLLAAPAWAFVDLNTATRSELESLKGIGPTKAQAIIEYRAKHGPFKCLEDLEKVKGIGKATLEKLRPQVTVTPNKVSWRLNPAAPSPDQPCTSLPSRPR